MRVNIRPFSSGDTEAVRQVHPKAFAGPEAEARLVEALHAADAVPVPLVAPQGLTEDWRVAQAAPRLARPARSLR